MSLTKASYSMIQGAPANLLDFILPGDVGTTNDVAYAFTAAIAKRDRVYIPQGTYYVRSTINLLEGSYLYGDGIDTSTIISTAAGFTFELLNANGQAQVNAPKFFDLSLYTTNSGIRLNSQTGGFTDGTDSQSYMMRPVVERCLIQSSTYTGTGIQWSKCFDGSINNSKIANFAYDIDFLGCDLNLIFNNRIIEAATNNIRARSINTFGSQTLILHNDILNSNTTTTALISSSDADILIKDNYLEGYPSTAIPTVILINGGNYASIENNRIEFQSLTATNWLTVSANLFNIFVTNNKNSGTGWGAALFNSGNGSLFYRNTSHRQLIYHANNSTEAGFPYCSTPDQSQILGYKSAWQMSPSVLSLTNSDNGANIVIKNNAFVIPPVAATTPISFNNPNIVVTGSINGSVLAFSNTANQRLEYQILSGNTIVTTGYLTLTTTLAWYTIASAVSVTDLYVKFYNNDTTINSNANLMQININYV
jgi:hypothetical protein